jgi:hypothetical protein
VSDRRTLIERIVVAVISAAIAIIFVVATKPWKANLPRDHKPTNSTSQPAAPR